MGLKIQSVLTMEEKFKKVALSGGGVKGLAELGALHYFFEKGQYDPKEVDTYTGTSIGSVISLLLICGYAPMEIFHRAYQREKFFDLKTESVWQIFEKIGLLSIDSFTQQIEDLVKEKMGNVPTLRELFERTQKTLIVASANVTEENIVYFSPKSHPDLSSIDAVKMSCNLPVICQKLSHQGHLYVDGGVLDGFPIQQVDDGHSPILGVVVLGTDSSLKDTTFIGYLYRLINMPINMITKLRCQGLGKNVTLVKINCEGVPLFQFSMPSGSKMDLFLQGYSKAELVDHFEDLVVKDWPDETDFVEDSSSSDWDLDWNPFKE